MRFVPRCRMRTISRTCSTCAKSTSTSSRPPSAKDSEDARCNCSAARSRRRSTDMVRRNPTRADLLERFQAMIAEYNAGSASAEQLFEQLLDFIQTMSDEEQRATREGLDEEELAIFDLLTKPEPRLSKAAGGRGQDDCTRLARQAQAREADPGLALEGERRRPTCGRRSGSNSTLCPRSTTGGFGRRRSSGPSSSCLKDTQQYLSSEPRLSCNRLGRASSRTLPCVACNGIEKGRGPGSRAKT